MNILVDQVLSRTRRFPTGLAEPLLRVDDLLVAFRKFSICQYPSDNNLLKLSLDAPLDPLPFDELIRITGGFEPRVIFFYLLVLVVCVGGAFVISYF